MVYRSREEYRRLGMVHRWNAILVLFLLISGLLLYAEPLRGVLAPVRVLLKNLHIWSGIALFVLGVATVAQWGPFALRRGLQIGRRLNTWLSALWLVAWTVTGVLMWLRGSVPFEVTAAATEWHGWLSWLALPWITLHTAFRLARVGRIEERVARTGEAPQAVAAWMAAPATRRGVLWVGFATLAMVLAGRWFRSVDPGRYAYDGPPEPPVDPATLPGGGMKGRFRLYFINNVIPRFDPYAWTLKVGGKTYTWAQYNELPHEVFVRNFHCVTGWSVFDVTWEGVRLRDLLRDAGVEPSANLIFHSGDGEYTDSLTWEQAQHDDIWLVHRMEGRALPIAQGGPVRLLVPHMYAYKSVKWVERITTSADAGYMGYWQLRGYPVHAYLEKGEAVRGSSQGQPGDNGPAGKPEWRKYAAP